MPIYSPTPFSIFESFESKVFWLFFFFFRQVDKVTDYDGSRRWSIMDILWRLLGCFLRHWSHPKTTAQTATAAEATGPTIPPKGFLGTMHWACHRLPELACACLWIIETLGFDALIVTGPRSERPVCLSIQSDVFHSQLHTHTNSFQNLPCEPQRALILHLLSGNWRWKLRKRQKKKDKTECRDKIICFILQMMAHGYSFQPKKKIIIMLTCGGLITYKYQINKWWITLKMPISISCLRGYKWRREWKVFPLSKPSPSYFLWLAAKAHIPPACLESSKAFKMKLWSISLSY